MPAPGLGRVVPPDWRHVELWPARAIIETLDPVPPGALRRWRTPERYHQDGLPQCTDYGTCTLMSANELANEGQTVRFRPGYGYRWAVKHDDLPEPQEGTTSRAILDYARKLGMIPVRREDRPRRKVQTYRWCRDINELRAALYHVSPVPIGINWYAGMSDPGPNQEMRRNGPLEGGHYIVLDELDDARGIAWATNTWGLDWPERGLPPETQGRAFFTLETLDRVVFQEDGEAAIVTDRLERNQASPATVGG
jgi:hypothetical protein